jgi:hypothetical protein
MFFLADYLIKSLIERFDLFAIKDLDSLFIGDFKRRDLFFFLVDLTFNDIVIFFLPIEIVIRQFFQVNLGVSIYITLSE